MFRNRDAYETIALNRDRRVSRERPASIPRRAKPPEPDCVFGLVCPAPGAFYAWHAWIFFGRDELVDVMSCFWIFRGELLLPRRGYR